MILSAGRDRLAADPDALRDRPPPTSCARPGVEPRHELPGVGRNLQDHPYLTMLWEVSEGRDPLRRRQAQAPARVAAAPQRPADLDAPPRSSPSSAPAPGCRPPTSSSTWAPLYFENHGEEEFDGHAMTIAPVLVSPKARGQVWLRSADPLAKPRIVTNSLADPDDVASMVAGMQHGARDRRRVAGRRGRRPRAQARRRRRDARAARGRAARAPRADLPPGRHLPDERRRRRRGRRLPAARPRDRRPAGRRRLDLPADPRRQHERADDHGRRAGRRPDPRIASPATPRG